MDCDPRSVSATTTVPPASPPKKMTEAESRKQILDSYERKGVDLPIVTLEMVLDRDTSALDYNAAYNKKKKKTKKKNRLFGRFAKSEPSKEEVPCRDTLPQQNQEESGKALVAERSSASYHGDQNMGPVQGETVEATNNGKMPQNNAALGIFCCPQHHLTSENETIIANGAVSDESKRSTDPTVMFCCPRNQIMDKDSQYIKSKLQLPEGCEDKDDAQYQAIMEKGSLIDADESVVTSNAEDQDEMLHTNRDKSKEGDYFWGSCRFRWTVVLCFLLHVVVISLIIIVALNSREDQNSVVVAQSQASVNTTEQSGVGDCVDELKLSATCYGMTSNVLVDFRSCDPQVGDWIAVYAAWEDSTNLMGADNYNWMYTCGSRNCEGAVFSNIVPFRAATLFAGGTDIFPMLKVHMMREGPGPSFEAFASSKEFRVVPTVQDC
jgi:hypothetical protein